MNKKVKSYYKLNNNKMIQRYNNLQMVNCKVQHKLKIQIYLCKTKLLNNLINKNKNKLKNNKNNVFLSILNNQMIIIQIKMCNKKFNGLK